MRKRTEVAGVMFLQVGRKRYQVSGFEQASAMFCRARDAAMTNGLEPNEVPQTFIVDESGKKIARVSWNGRVWPPAEWKRDMIPLYDNLA
jgi:hypothetical protein